MAKKVLTKLQSKDNEFSVLHKVKLNGLLTEVHSDSEGVLDLYPLFPQVNNDSKGKVLGINSEGNSFEWREAGGEFKFIKGKPITLYDTDATTVLSTKLPENMLFLDSEASILSIIYPVGSIYLSVNNVNPAALFGGTWEQIKDTFLLAAGDTYAAGSTGGEAQHTLTVAEMPKHTHKSSSYDNFMRYLGSGGNFTSGSGSQLYGLNLTLTTAGNDQPHNNMPPYLTVYMWRRTA